jgi:ATP-dependent Clp protease adaptor protein ClpS
MSMASTDIVARVKKNLELKEPPMFKIIYINDNVTTVDFVVKSLIDHFRYTQETAEKLTMDIHELGSATVAVLPFEVAEQKGIEVTLDARTEGFPLQVRLEPEEA